VFARYPMKPRVTRHDYHASRITHYALRSVIFLIREIYKWQIKTEFASFSYVTFHPDSSSVSINSQLAEGKPQASGCPQVRNASALCVNLNKFLENSVLIIFRYALAFICYIDSKPFFHFSVINTCRNNPVWRRVLYCII